MANPPEAPETIKSISEAVDWTWVMSVIVVCVSGLVAAYKIFGGSRISEEKLRNNKFCQEHREHFNEVTENLDLKIQRETKELEVETRAIKEKLITLTGRFETLKKQIEHLEQSTNGLKADYSYLVSRLDELVSNLSEWTK